MCNHANDPGGREAAMVVTHRNDQGVPTVWCDPCLAPIIKALNDGGIRTIASCCGHENRAGNIMLADGRDLFIATPEQAKILHTASHHHQLTTNPEYAADYQARAGHGERNKQ